MLSKTPLNQCVKNQRRATTSRGAARASKVRRQGMIQNSSRARRLEVEDSMISVRESVAYNSCRLALSFAALFSALFVRDVPISHTNHSRSGGTATSNARVSTEADP